MRRKTVLLLHDSHVPWYCTDARSKGAPEVFGRGFAVVKGRFCEGQALVDAVRQACSESDGSMSAERLKRLIPTLNGGWALAVRWPNGAVLAATDRMRTIPLFYASLRGRFVLAVSALDIVRQEGFTAKLDELSAVEYLVCGYVTGQETLFCDVRKMQAGETLEFKPAQGGSVETNRYYRFFPEQYSDASEEELEDEFCAISEEMFAVQAQSLNGKRVVIPLSGGLDSRFVAGMLRKAGVEDVVCFTYGPEGNEDAAISKQVADSLGYQWKFVGYDEAVWGKCMGSQAMQDYWEYSSKGVSMPHVQDFPALLALAEEGYFTEDCVFFPGHSADMLAGSHIPANYLEYEESRQDVVVEDILRVHYKFWPLSNIPRRTGLADAIVDRIKSQSRFPGTANEWKQVTRYEMWGAEARQALYVINSVRAYERVSPRWRTLWDYSLMDFFLKVPLEYRVGKRLYVNTLRKKLFTGPAEELGRLPVAGLGEWTDDFYTKCTKWGKKQRGAGMKAMVRTLARSLGLEDWMLDRVHPNTVPDPTRFDCWFGDGLDPMTVTLRDVLQKYNTLENLPASAISVMKPLLNRRIDLLYFKAPLAAVSLGELAAIPAKTIRTNY